jgi:hypothetical protein
MSFARLISASAAVAVAAAVSVGFAAAGPPQRKPATKHKHGVRADANPVMHRGAGEDPAAYWTPERMRNAQPVPNGVPGGGAPSPQPAPAPSGQGAGGGAPTNP